MFLRALFAFLMVPCLVAGIIPYIMSIYDPFKTEGNLWGFFIFALGWSILLCCVRDFYVSGKGTLAPWDPPKNLVTIGLYQYVRNPMYISVIFILSGWIVITASPIVFGFTLLLATAFHFRVKLHEEPWAENSFQSEWESYKNHVPRWLPHLK